MKISIHKLDSIQVLRAIAVILVVYVHCIPSAENLFGYSPDFSVGALGVDLFFTISGFIMTRIFGSYYEKGGWKFFAVKRVARILPLYWGLSLGKFIIDYFYGHTVAEFRAIIKTVIFLPIFDNPFTNPIIPAGWSLSYELYFYLLITLLLVWRTKHIPALLSCLLVGLSIAGLLFNPQNTTLNFLTSPLLFEFALGVLAGLIYDQAKKTIGWNLIAGISLLLGSGIIVSFIWLKVNDFQDPLFLALNSSLAAERSLVWGIPSALLLLGSTLAERFSSFRIPAWVILVGDASYSNYLLHQTILGYSLGFIKRLPFPFVGPVSYSLFMVIGCTAISIPFYLRIEKPLTIWFSRKLLPLRL